MELQQKDFEALEDMFASKGWKIFIEAAKELKEALDNNAVDIADTNDKWQYHRGQVHQLRSLTGYEDYIRALWSQQEEEEALDAEADA